VSYPKWLKDLLIPKSREVRKLYRELNIEDKVHTVCESALCPNRGECFSKKTMTFMILGDICTRKCTFCAVSKGSPVPPDIKELDKIAEIAQKLDLKHIVITSVTRDDLEDGGANHYVKLISLLRKQRPQSSIEILVPDFQGNKKALQQVFQAKPDVFNHNLETIQRLYPEIRPQADYTRSLSILKMAKNQGLITKSGLMLGVGEKKSEIFKTLSDLKEAGVQIVTIGQYLSPGKSNFPVRKYVEPDIFKTYKEYGQSLGIDYISSAPLVRSSYMAEDAFMMVKNTISNVSTS